MSTTATSTELTYMEKVMLTAIELTVGAKFLTKNRIKVVRGRKVSYERFMCGEVVSWTAHNVVLKYEEDVFKIAKADFFTENENRKYKKL